VSQYESQLLKQFQDGQTFVTVHRPVFWGLVGLIFLLAIVSTVLIGLVLRNRRRERTDVEAEDRYRQMFEGNPAIQLLIDPETTCFFDANPAAAEFYGYDVNCLRSMKLSDISLVSLDVIRRNLEEAKRHKFKVIRLQHRTRSGQIREMEACTIPVTIDGKILVHTILNDVTDRKIAEERLAKEQAERAFIRETFGSFLSEEIVEEILRSPESMPFGGETREITILVSDLRGFTSLCESLDSPQIVLLLNRYLETMTDVIIKHGGNIDEFTGDGILVFFGCPVFVPDHPARAVACALEMQQALQWLNGENAELDLPELSMGIGINSGRLAVGIMGSKKRKKYGAIGSPINMAYRVEAQAEGGEILVAQPVYERLGQSLRVAAKREVFLKGIASPVPIYLVRGIGD
jgi:PAS domain S-box-containing protein